MINVQAAIGGQTTSGNTANAMGTMKSEDFLNVMITQLQNQDPLEPMDNEQLLSQLSQIYSLESNMRLTETLDKLSGNQQMSSASTLIGKVVSGLNESDSTAIGRVASVSIEDGEILLELDTGDRMNINQIQRVVPVENLIGQVAIGYGADGEQISGSIIDVLLGGDSLTLVLDNGDELPMHRVESISSPGNNDNKSSGSA